MKDMIKSFVEENQSIYKTATEELKDIFSLNKGVVTAVYQERISSKGNHKGFFYKYNGEEYFAETLEELKDKLSNLGYSLEKSNFRRYDFKNKEIAEVYETELKNRNAFNERIKDARKEIRRKARDFLFNNYVHTYVRYGLIPESGKSYNFRDEYFEDGVSVYEAAKVGYKYYIDVFGNVFTYGDFQGKDAFEVSGEVLDTRGSDGEPLLSNVKIIKKIKNDSIELIDDFICEVFK